MGGRQPPIAGGSHGCMQAPEPCVSAWWARRALTGTGRHPLAAASKRQASIATPIGPLFPRCSGNQATDSSAQQAPAPGATLADIHVGDGDGRRRDEECIGTRSSIGRTSLEQLEDGGEASLNSGRMNASRPLACLVSASAICKSRLRRQRHVPCAVHVHVPAHVRWVPNDGDGNGLCFPRLWFQ